MLVKVGVDITAIDGTIGPKVQEGVEEMGDLVGREIGRLVVAAIDTPLFRPAY